MTTRTVISPRKRTHAARLLRQGKSYPAVERETGISKRTLFRWMKYDDDFLMLVHGAGTLQVGPIRILADHDAPLLDEAPDESLVWIARAPEPEVLGSVHVQDASHLRCIFVTNVQRARDELQAGRIPYDPDAKTTTLRATALPAFADPDDVQLLLRLTSDDEATAFAAFLPLWHFKAGETKDIRTLGELWESQATLSDALTTNPHVYAAKARKLGETTLAVAYCGFASRFRDQGNTRVHEFSYRERAALQLLADTRYGLDHLPEWLRLPIKRETLKQVVYDAGSAEQIVEAFPTSESTAVELTATHSMIDELADIPQNEKVFASLYPTFSAPGCTSTILTTGKGPQDWSADYWRQCTDGDGIHVPLFIPATARPGRDEAWLERTRRQMTQAAFRTEYALQESDVFAGHSGFTFKGEDIDRSHSTNPALTPGLKFYCTRHPHVWRTRNPRDRCPSCRNRVVPVPFILGWDIGGAEEKSDASVGTVLDVAGDYTIVAEQRRFVGIPFAQLQKEIERLANYYTGAPTVIEMSGIGAAVFGNVELPTRRLVEFWTTERSKARIIGNVQLALEQGTIKFNHADIPQLRKELLGYQTPDTYCQTDTVMSLAVTLGCAGEAYVKPARVMTVMTL